MFADIPNSMIIDLRSDTLTKPTPGMTEAMAHAKVGDDVFGEDPTVNELQQRMARMFGHEAGLFVPSGTMGNQIAINVHTSPGDEVICSSVAHVYLYEGGGIARNSGASVRLIEGNRGRLSAADIRANKNNPADAHLPFTTLVCVEDTCNKGGGAIYDIESLREISKVCKELGLSLHLDGARVFNALVATGNNIEEYGKLFDSISICLSKGLGAPIGSVLLGTTDFIKKSHRVRKVYGGGMRQAGILAAAGLYALDHHVERLKEDHHRASEIGKVLSTLPWVSEVLPVDTNIVIFGIKPPHTPAEIVAKLKEQNVLCFPFGADKIRFVVHLDIDDNQLNELRNLLISLI